MSTSTSGGGVKIRCANKDCDNDLHCFRPKLREWKAPKGVCQGCGDASIDWNAVRSSDTGDAATRRTGLKKEWIRHYFWTKEIDSKSRAVLASMSRVEIEALMRDRIRKAVGIATPFRDGMQTPTTDTKLAGHPEYYAQHATACCCKKCAYYWWGFPRNQAYTEVQIDFLIELCMEYFEERELLH